MVAIADSVPKPASRFRFILDRRDVLGAIFVAPAILYVLLLVGVPTWRTRPPSMTAIRSPMPIAST